MRRCLNCMKVYEREYDVCPYCGHIHNSKPAREKFLLPGTVLKDRYILGTVIGSGGFGITYVAWDNLLQAKVAIKEYFPSAITSRTNNSIYTTVMGEENIRQYNAGLKKFLDEARRIAKFNKDEHIVHVYDFIEANNTAYMVMEFVGGKTLKSIIEEQKSLHISEAVRIISDIAEALNKVHEEGIIHRDISPDNIIIQKNGGVKIIDFGAAKLFVGEAAGQSSVILKPSYSPPEQYLRNNVQDRRTDIYALGAVFYHMITGIKPQEAMSRFDKDELILPSLVIKGIPKWADGCVLKAMALEANERFRTMIEFKKALEDQVNFDERIIYLGKGSGDENTYLRQFDHMKSTGKKASWHWAGFFFPTYWLAYRKMYGYAVLSYVANILFQIIGWAILFILLPNLWEVETYDKVISILMQIPLRILVGAFANYLYMRKIDKLVEKGKQLPENMRAAHEKKGGTSIVAAIIAVLAVGMVSVLLS